MIKRYPLILYFILTFFIMWSMAAIGIILELPFHHPVMMTGFAIGAFVPTISAIITIKISEDKTGLKKLFKQFLIWRINPFWYFIALSPIIISIIIGIIYCTYTNSYTENTNRNLLNFLLLSIFTLIPGPISEEAGWRGYALQKMLSKYNGIISGLIIGFIWGLWHLPLFFIKGSPQYDSSLLFFILQIISINVIHTWIYINTRYSLFLMVLLHWAMNFGTSLIVGYFSLIPGPLFYMIFTIVYIIISTTVFIIFGPKLKLKENR